MTKKKSAVSAAPALEHKPTAETVKCPGCHAYFVEEGELCANCQKKEEAQN